MVLDTMLERMKVEDTLNIYDYVKQLREQRVLMVQTLVRPIRLQLISAFDFIYYRLSTCSFMMLLMNTYSVDKQKS